MKKKKVRTNRRKLRNLLRRYGIIRRGVSQLATIPLPEFYREFDRFLDGEVSYDEMWSEFIPKEDPWRLSVRWRGGNVICYRVKFPRADRTVEPL